MTTSITWTPETSPAVAALLNSAPFGDTWYFILQRHGKPNETVYIGDTVVKDERGITIVRGELKK